MKMQNQRWMSSVAVMFALGCGLPATQADLKLVGVGLDPDSIGAAPSWYGGLVEYGMYDFSGGGLPLAMLGLLSYDAVGPGFNGYQPPYRLIRGSGFVFQDDQLDPEALYGNLPPAPAVKGFCHTRLDPQAYISNVVDVGSEISLKSDDGRAGFRIDRRPAVFPPDVRSVFTSYSSLQTWQPEPKLASKQLDPNNKDLGALVPQILSRANFAEGAVLEMNFPGGVPPEEIEVASIPVPLATAGSDRNIRLPHMSEGVRMSWTGPVYTSDGLPKAAIGSERDLERTNDDGNAVWVSQYFDGVRWWDVPDGNTSDEDREAYEAMREQSDSLVGSYSTCLQYVEQAEVPLTAEDCIALAEPPNKQAELDARDMGHLGLGDLPGQIYTGPWETDGLLFEWNPIPEGEHEQISVTVRFFGAVEKDDENLIEPVVFMDPTGESVREPLEETWSQMQELDLIPESADIPMGRRDALACDEDYELADTPVIRDTKIEIEYPLKEGLVDHDGESVPSLQGDPFSVVSEVVCRLDQDVGSFELTQAMIENAYNYAQVRGAEGAVFFFTRTNVDSVQGPPVRDTYGHRHVTSPIKVVSRAVRMGRFWYDQ